METNAFLEFLYSYIFNPEFPQFWYMIYDIDFYIVLIFDGKCFKQF
jgi:hypothetical protein